MTLETGLFAAVASGTAASALGVVLSPGIVRAAVWLLFTLIGVSMLYFLLGAEFLGAAQLIVYVGGTLVLVIFGIMLTAQGPLHELKARLAEWAIGVTIGLILLALLTHAVSAVGTGGTTEDPLPGPGGLGLAFLGISEASTTAAYLLPFEIVSVHLLVVLIGAAYLARAKRHPSPPASAAPSAAADEATR